MQTSITLNQRDHQISSWFAEHSNRLLGYIKSKINDRNEAEDIAQEIWYQLTLQQDLDNIGQIGSWLFSAAKNRVVNFYKKKKNIPFSKLENADTNSGMDENENKAVHEALFDQWMADNISSEMLDSGEFWTLLDKALGKLPAEQREVFIAHEIEDLSFKEISEKTGVSVNTLLARKRYAVLRLREMFFRE